uniref:Uncharacterized protein n=1 Tax=Romanomermis culicivorax TaxID=13658 RepID=A0A915J782_ROMCU
MVKENGQEKYQKLNHFLTRSASELPEVCRLLNPGALQGDKFMDKTTSSSIGVAKACKSLALVSSPSFFNISLNIRLSWWTILQEYNSILKNVEQLTDNSDDEEMLLDDTQNDSAIQQKTVVSNSLAIWIHLARK